MYNYYIMQCDREIIAEADLLAKNGAKLPNIRMEWLESP